MPITSRVLAFALALLICAPGVARSFEASDYQARERQDEETIRKADETLRASTPKGPVPMMRVVLLTVIFGDSWLGGSTPSGYFRSMEGCRAEGDRLALMYLEQHHPASAVCTWKMAPKSREKMVRD